MVQKRNIPYESDIMSPYEDDVMYVPKREEKEALTDVGKARGRLEFMLERRGRLTEKEMWETIERVQDDLGNAVIKLKQVI